VWGAGVQVLRSGPMAALCSRAAEQSCDSGGWEGTVCIDRGYRGGGLNLQARSHFLRDCDLPPTPVNVTASNSSSAPRATLVSEGRALAVGGGVPSAMGRPPDVGGGPGHDGEQLVDPQEPRDQSLSGQPPGPVGGKKISVDRNEGENEP